MKMFKLWMVVMLLGLLYTKKVLKAAALTYVASAAAAILQLLRLVLLFGGRDRD